MARRSSHVKAGAEWLVLCRLCCLRIGSAYAEREPVGWLVVSVVLVEVDEVLDEVDRTLVELDFGDPEGVELTTEIVLVAVGV